MESPTRRIVVFSTAVRAQRKCRHGRVRPVVGNCSDNGESGAAVRTVDQGVSKATIERIMQLVQARSTRPDISGDDGRHVAAARTGPYDKPGLDRTRRRRSRGAAKLHHRDRLHVRQRRRRRLQPLNERVHHCRGSGKFDEDALTVVTHGSVQTQLRCEPVHKRSKANALDQAHDANLPPRINVAIQAGTCSSMMSTRRLICSHS